MAGQAPGAEALKAHLAYRRSVALADISTAVDNVFVQTGKGYLLSNNSVLVYDNVYGGLGLTEALWWNLEEYATQLLQGAHRERRRWAGNQTSSLSMRTSWSDG